MIERMKRNNVNPKACSTTQPQWDKILGAVLGFICIGTVLCLLFVDDGLAQWIYARKLSWPLRAWPMGFRQLGKAWAAIWLLCLWFWVTRQSRPVLCAVLALVLTLPLVLPLKGIVGRVRPGEVFAAAQSASDLGVLRGHSFPSGDTSTVFAVAGALIGFVRRSWCCLLFAGALGVGMLRVIILAHYLSDISAGMAIGLLCGALARHLHRRLNMSTIWLDQRHWIALIVLGITPIAMGLCEGPEPVLLFFRTFGMIAIGVALFYRTCIRRRCHR